jgi:Zyg-11 family protein
LVKSDGYKSLKIIYNELDTYKDESIKSLCEKIFNNFEKKYLKDQILICSESGEILFQKTADSKKSIMFEKYQIMDKLRRFKHCDNFVTKITKTLFILHECFFFDHELRTDFTNLLLVLIQMHSHSIKIQIYVTACLYKTTENELSTKIENKVLERVVESSMKAMDTFKNNDVLQTNILLILLNDHILENISFDKYKCIQLVFDTLVNFKGVGMNREALEICSILSAKITYNEKSNLCSNPIYLEKLIDMIKSRIDFVSQNNKTMNFDYDIMLEHALSTLTNLTDLPEICGIFIEKEGIELYLFIINVRIRV